MSKKLALATDGIVFDVKSGNGAFMKGTGAAARLAKALLSVARGHDLAARALISNMNQPTGFMIGNFLEVIEVVDVLQGGGPADTVELSLELCGQMLLVGGIDTNLAAARRRARRVLESGEAYEVFCRYVADCDGNSKTLLRPRRAMAGVHKAVVTSSRAGYIGGIETTRLGLLAGRLGAGRARASDHIDPLAGIEMQVQTGDRIDRGDALAVLYSSDGGILDQVRSDLPATIQVGSSKPEVQKLVLRRLTDA
jgi:thymidine phosphorylase